MKRYVGALPAERRIPLGIVKDGMVIRIAGRRHKGNGITVYC